MTRAYNVRFDETDTPLPDMIDRLGVVLADRKIIPHSVSWLARANDRPTVDLSQLSEIPVVDGDLSPVGPQVASWWGVNIYCVSLALAERFGRGDAMEVDFAIFHTPSGRRTLEYKESSRVYDARVTDEDAENELYALQLMLCSALGFRISDYDEETSPLTRSPCASLHEAQRIIERAVQKNVGTAVVIAQSLLGMPDAEKLAGKRADDVKFTATGYLLFRLLHKHR